MNYSQFHLDIESLDGECSNVDLTVGHSEEEFSAGTHLYWVKAGVVDDKASFSVISCYVMANWKDDAIARVKAVAQKFLSYARDGKGFPLLRRVMETGRWEAESVTPGAVLQAGPNSPASGFWGEAMLEEVGEESEASVVGCLEDVRRLYDDSEGEVWGWSRDHKRVSRFRLRNGKGKNRREKAFGLLLPEGLKEWVRAQILANFSEWIAHSLGGEVIWDAEDAEFFPPKGKEAKVKKKLYDWVLGRLESLDDVITGSGSVSVGVCSWCDNRTIWGGKVEGEVRVECRHCRTSRVHNFWAFEIGPPKG